MTGISCGENHVLRGFLGMRNCGRILLAAAVGLGLIAMLIGTGKADAATPVIQNTSSTNSQTNWLESFTVSDHTGREANRVWVTLTVKHDPGRKVTGIRIDDDYNGTDNASSATLRSVTAQQPTIVNGFDYSRISYNYLAPTSGNGLSCNVITGGTDRSTVPLRIRAQLDNGDQTATSSSNLRWTRSDCTSRDDFPHLYSRSQSASSVNVGDSVTFTFTGDDTDSGLTSNQAWGGVNWRLRRLSDGTTTTAQKVCFGSSDNTQRTLSVPFNRRGRWVVEAEVLNENNTCGTNPDAGGWFYIGAVDVNSPAADSPELTLNATRPQIGGDSTVTASFNDNDDQSNEGRVQILEWDLDQNTSNGVSGFEIAQLGDWKTSVTTPQTRTIDTSGMTPGPKTVRARVTDNGAMSAADNIRRTKIVTTTFLVDTPPVATPNSVRTITGEILTVPLQGTDVDEDTLTYTIVDPPDHGTLTGSGSNRFYTSDPGFAGTDTFTFQVDDGYGGTDTAEVTVRVDPDITGFDGPNGTQDSRAGEIEFGSSVAGATFECQLDDSVWLPCTAPWSVNDLADGSHTMRARVTANGLTNPDFASASWTVDAYPKVQINDGPDPQVNTQGVSVDFALSEVGSTTTPTSECRLDGLPWAPCGSPIAFDDLDDGSHTIQIRATDAYGKQHTESVTWSVITGGTETSFDGPALEQFTRGNAASLAFSATGNPASFECSVDGSAWQTCTSPLALTDLADGSHTVRVRAIDTLGNPESTPAQISWTVDRTLPVVKIAAGPEGPVPAGSSAFVFSSNESFSTFECKLDDGDYTSCSSPFAVPEDLADGAHTFRVAARDRAGNRSFAARRDFRILSVAPEAVLSAGPSQGELTRANLARFEFGSTSPVAGFECSLDGSDWAPCASPHTVNGLADGQHSFAVRAIDEVGNRSATTTVRDWAVDTTPPETTITAGPDSTDRTGDASLAFEASEAGSTFMCSLDGAAFSACASPSDYTGLADGRHEFRVKAVDAAGNVDQTPASREWTVDTSAVAPPDPPDPPVQPLPCTFKQKQESCDDPFLVATVKAPLRKARGNAAMRFELDSGGPALSSAVIRFTGPLSLKALPGRKGRKVGQVILTGTDRTVRQLKLPTKTKAQNVVAGGANAGPTVVLKRRTVVVSGLPADTTGIRVDLRGTAGLKVKTSVCGTRLWSALLTDTDSNQMDVNTKADVTCIRKASR